jgi:hypothetical protein
LADLDGEGVRWFALFRLSFYGAGGFQSQVRRRGFECRTFSVKNEARASALVRLSPAKSAFARLFVGSFFCDGGRTGELPDKKI